jgi:2-keto-myo-inositol isomerase
MRTSTMRRNVADFGMDTISLAGPLEAKLAAVKAAGFGQIMLAARDIVGHPEGIEAAVHAVRSYKVDIAKQMILMARDLGAPLLLACSSTSSHATADAEAIARDLRKLALLALPHGIRVAFEGLSWGRHINEVHQAWAAVEQADCPNLGLAIDSYHQFATSTPLTALEDVDPEKIYLVQLSDFMWQETRTVQERIDTARHFRVFPGEGVHSQALAQLVRTLDGMGYQGDYSFEVFNDDYQQLPLPYVAQRAWNSALWLAEGVLQRAVPLPGHSRIRAVA